MVAIRYSVSPLRTSAVDPGFGGGYWRVAGGLPRVVVRTTVVLAQAASSADISRQTKIRKAVRAGRRASSDRMVRIVITCASTAEPLEQLAHRQTAAADQHAELDDGADIRQMPQQHRHAIALDEADRVQQQG